jgi:rRNA maturation endonuclease Nob1
MTLKRIAFVCCVTVAMMAPAVSASAQTASAKAQTGTQFYMAYLEAFAKAKSLDEVSPWLAKERRDQIAKTPKDEQAMMFGMIKEMSADNTSIKVVKEAPTATGADLDVEAVSKADKSKVTGKISLVKEDGQWKVSKESWKS